VTGTQELSQVSIEMNEDAEKLIQEADSMNE
jgi:hypothetical protein